LSANYYKPFVSQSSPVIGIIGGDGGDVGFGSSNKNSIIEIKI
jgi:hypothetical protein